MGHRLIVRILDSCLRRNDIFVYSRAGAWSSLGYGHSLAFVPRLPPGANFSNVGLYVHRTEHIDVRPPVGHIIVVSGEWLVVRR